MKRLVIRLSVLSVVVVMGLIAIAQARHGFDAAPADAAAAPAQLPWGAPQPIETEPVTNPLRNAATPPVNELRPAAAVEAPRFDDLPPAQNQMVQYEAPAAPERARELPPELALEPAASNEIPDYREVQTPAAAPVAAAPAPGRYADAAPVIPQNPQENLREAAPDLGFPNDAAAAAPVVNSPRPLAPAALPDAALAHTSAPAAPLAAAPREIPPAGDYREPANRFAPPAEAQPLAAPEVAAQAATGSGQPGPKQLEGLQSASVTLRKVAPREMQVGKQCTFEILVRNSGRTPASGVQLLDQVPRGATFVGAEPRPDQSADGQLLWKLGDLEAGQELKVLVHLMPVAEGEIGSVATLRLAAAASASVVATKPQLVLRLTAEAKVMIGERVKVGIELSNPGTGPATGVMLFENIPQGVTHEAGDTLEFEVGALMPGESKKLELELTAVDAGMVKNVMVATSDANLQAQDAVEFEVVAPKLDVAVEGPAKRYLERPATYTLSIGNPGTAAARDIELVSYLPKGMKFVKANNSGQYDPATHSVSWGLAELPAKQSGAVELVAVPIESGELSLRVEGKAQQGLSDKAEQTVQVEGLAAIMFSVADLQDPIELGGETTYEIRVVNQGSKSSDNVRLTALIPPGLKAVSATGPTPFEITGGQVNFAPLARLAPKADTTYHVTVQAVGPGDHRLRVQVGTDELQTPVTKEESTRVYSDQ